MLFRFLVYKLSKLSILDYVLRCTYYNVFANTIKLEKKYSILSKKLLHSDKEYFYKKEAVEN
jgi:hypothetical protein